MAGVEIGRRLLGRDHRDVVGEDAVQRLGRARSEAGRRPTSTLATWPSAWTPVSVRPATARPSNEAVQLAERPPKLAFDGAEAWLGRPAAKAGAVVLDREPEPHRTIIAA